MVPAPIEPCRVLLAVDPPVLEELLRSLLARPELDIVAADDHADAEFDVLVSNRALQGSAAAATVRLPTSGEPDVAVVSTPSGEREVELVGVSDLALLITSLCPPTRTTLDT